MTKNISIIAILLIITTLGLSRIQYNEAVTQIYEANKRAELLKLDIQQVQNELEAANNMIADLKSDEYEFVYVGEYKISYYCDERRSHICGGSGRTASGKPTEVGMTAAADWSVLPKGSMVYIENIGWREIQDKGGAVKGKHLDVLVSTHQEALKLGKDQEGVWVLVKK